MKQNVFKGKTHKKFMNKFISILFGLILLIAGVLVWGNNWAGFGDAALAFLQGGIVWLVLLIGLMLVILGISDLKD